MLLKNIDPRCYITGIWLHKDYKYVPEFGWRCGKTELFCITSGGTKTDFREIVQEIKKKLYIYTHTLPFDPGIFLLWDFKEKGITHNVLMANLLTVTLIWLLNIGGKKKSDSKTKFGM